MPTITISERTGADYAGIASANLNSGAPTTNVLGGGEFEVTERTGGDYKHQLFVITNNTGLSGTITVSGADFKVRCFDASDSTHDFALINVTAAATASQATWNNRTTGSAWAVAGGFTQGQSDATDVDTTAVATASNATIGADLTFTGAGLNTLLSQLLSGSISEIRLLMVRTDGANDFTFAGFRNTGDTSVGPILTIPYTVGSSGPTVSSVSSNGATEGSAITHTVTLSSATTGTENYAATLVGVTATGGGTDFTSNLASATYSNGVTFSGGNMVVPTAVSSFTVSVPTTADTLDEDNETYTLTVGGVAGTGTTTDDDALPNFTGTTSATVDPGDPVVITYTLSAVSGRTITRTLTLTDGTSAGGGVDYTSSITSGMFSNGVTISGSTVTIPAGVSSFTLSIPTTP